MNKDEKMIEEMAIIISGSTELDTMNYYSARYKAKDLYNANYRKVADDEIVESMKTYERARQETAREILQRFYNRAKSNKNDFADVNSYEIELMAEEFGIELE